MDVKPDRMISLGYGRFWRSDDIVGLVRIEHDRGPGRRTEVYAAGGREPVVASRSERAILQDMCVDDGELMHLTEAREAIGELAEVLDELPDVLKRMLSREGQLDTEVWVRRLRGALADRFLDDVTDQNELFD